jgi:uncharacterized protein (DUF433 family)
MIPNLFSTWLSAAMVYNQIAMTAPETTITVPFTLTEQGTIRIADSRVSLDSIVHHYKLGSTAEQIAYSFPSLSLADIHLAIAYYLTHRQEVEAYLRQQEVEGDALLQRIESDPKHQKRMTELRERLLARWSARQQSEGPTTSE